MCPGPSGQSASSSHPSAAATRPAILAALAALAAPATPFAVPTPLARYATAPIGLSTRDIAVPEAASCVFVGTPGITADVTVRDPIAHASELHIHAASHDLLTVL